MKDTSGKVILSLLAGATAGIVAGLLLAPETGEETRSGLKKSASKWGDDLSKLFKEGLSRLDQQQAGASRNAKPQAQTSADRSAADDLLNSMNNPDSKPASGAIFPEDIDSDYDGIGGDARHSSGYGRVF